MNWIDYYGLIICLWVLLCFLMVLVKKTRPVGLSFTFFSVILFVGLTSFRLYFGPVIVHSESKKQEFFELTKSGEEVALNLPPALWLQSSDGRGSNDIIPLEYRSEIGIQFPLGSAPNVKTLFCAEDDGFISFEADRFGFRNEDDEWNNTLHNILILGDSFAESACVPYAFQTHFAQNLSAVSLGKGGNGPLISLAAFIEYSNRFKAENVYFLVFSNDYSRPVRNKSSIDLERELREPQLLKYLNDPEFSQGYFNGLDLQAYRKFAVEYSKSLANTMDDSIDIQFLRTVSKLFFYDVIKNIILLQNIKNNIHEIKFINKSELEQVYTRAIYTAGLTSSRLIFVPLPDKSSSCKEEEKKRFINDLLIGLNANILEVWDDLCDKKYFANSGGHFNTLGYKALSDHIESDFLRKKIK